MIDFNEDEVRARSERHRDIAESLETPMDRITRRGTVSAGPAELALDMARMRMVGLTRTAFVYQARLSHAVETAGRDFAHNEQRIADALGRLDIPNDRW